jgi:hypothetical protein
METRAGPTADDLRILELLREQVSQGFIDAAQVDELEREITSPDRRDAPRPAS